MAQRLSSHNLTLTATKVSLQDSGTKSLADMDLNNSKSATKSMTLPTFDIFPIRNKSKVIANSTKQKYITERFDNQLQSYFQSSKNSQGFSSLAQTRAPTSPNKFEINSISFNNLSPQIQSKFPISMNSLTEFSSNMKTQQTQYLSTEQDQSIENQKLSHFENSQKMTQSQTNFGKQKSNQKSNKFLDFDILEQKEKIVNLIDKDRKLRQTNTSISKSRQAIKNHNIIEKVKREEKNFFMTVSIIDTKAQQLLKNISNPFVIKKKLSVKEKQYQVDNIISSNIKTELTNQTDLNINQKEQFQTNEKQIQTDDKIINQDQVIENNNQSSSGKPMNEQQIQQITTPSQLSSKNRIIEQIQEQKEEEESPLIVNKQNKHEYEIPTHYESLLTPIQETSFFHKSNSNKLDAASPKINELPFNVLANDNQINKLNETKIFERKTSIFKTHDQEFMKVTIISPQVENELNKESNSPLRISKLSSLFSDDDLQRRESLNFKDYDDNNILSPNQLRKISSSLQSQFDKSVLFDFGQEAQNKEKVNDISILSKSGQNKGILKKGPSKLSSFDGTDLSESDFTVSNKQSKIQFQNIKKMNTINPKTNTTPRKSYFKSFSSAIVNNKSDNESINNSRDESYRNNSKQKQGKPTKLTLTTKTQNKKPNYQQFNSSEYADDEYMDKSDLNESNMSGNTSLIQKQKQRQNQNKKAQRKSKTNLQTDKANESNQSTQKQIKSVSSSGKYKSSQIIEGVLVNNDSIRFDKNNQRKSINNKDKIIIKDLNKYSRNSGSLLKVQNSNSSLEQGNDEYDREDMNGETSYSSYFIKSQEGERITKKRKSRKYSIQVNDLAEYKQMEKNNTLSIGAIAKLFLKLHKAKKKSFFQMKRQPSEPIHLNYYQVSSNSNSDISFLQPNKKEESESNFNEQYDEFDNDSQTYNSFVIPSLNFGDIDSPFENSGHFEDGTSKNQKKRHLFKKLSSRKSFSQQPNSKQSKKILSLKSKAFDKTPSNNFDLRNTRKNEMALLRQKIETLSKQFRVEGQNLDQKKRKIQKLIQEVSKRNVKSQTKEAKQTENLIQAITTDLNYKKPNDEAYFEEIMSNAPIINDELVYFSKLRANKINDPQYLMKFEEQPIMFRENNFLTELKKENVYIDDEMLYKLHQQKMMNEDVNGILERRRLFEEQTKFLQKINQSKSSNLQVSNGSPYPHTIYQTELEYELLMEELGLKEKNESSKSKHTMLSQKLGNRNPKMLLENRIDKLIELAEKIKSLPLEKLKELKQKLKQVKQISKNQSIADINNKC